MSLLLPIGVLFQVWYLIVSISDLCTPTYFQQQQNLGQRFGTSKIHLSPAPGGLGCCPFEGGGSVLVDFLCIVTPIVVVCNCSLFFFVRYFMSILVLQTS